MSRLLKLWVYFWPTFTLLLCVIQAASATNDDDIICQDEANGTSVVLLTLARIRQSGIFQDDNGLLRRIAYVETRDGTCEGLSKPQDIDSDSSDRAASGTLTGSESGAESGAASGEASSGGTGCNISGSSGLALNATGCRSGEFAGGIWAVEEEKFAITFFSQPLLGKIWKEFGIDWPTVVWSNLSKPLYSAIAASLVLYNISAPIPHESEVCKQAEYWTLHYNQEGSVADHEFVQAIDELEVLHSCMCNISFGNAVYTVEEGMGFVTVSVVRSGNISIDVTAVVATSHQGGNASAGSDYGPLIKAVYFISGVTVINVTVMIGDDDDEVEPTKTFQLFLLISVEGDSLTPFAETEVIILDDDELSVTMTASSTESLRPTTTPTVDDMETSSSQVPILGVSTESLRPTTTPTVDDMESSSSRVPILGVATAGCVCLTLLVALVCITAVIVCCIRRKKRKHVNLKRIHNGDISVGFTNPIATLDEERGPRLELHQIARNQLDVIVNEMAEYLRIPHSSIELLNEVGQGNFGTVHEARLLPSTFSREKPCVKVAVRTLKGSYDQTQIRNLMKECLKAKDFNHPHIQELVGVCIDGGAAPFIVMPFMDNGSLLSCLRRRREKLLVKRHASEDETHTACKLLMTMCLQVAKGMEYLAIKKIVHRDLAARNCMLDDKFVIKVADFSPSESIYANYYMHGNASTMKLPVKWMAPESLSDGLYTKKTDVWSFGVTCWEVLTVGQIPYAGVADTLTLPRLLENGHRLGKPNNAACTNDIFLMMLSCWNAKPELRPSFTLLASTISKFLESLGGMFAEEEFKKALQD